MVNGCEIFIPPLSGEFNLEFRNETALSAGDVASFARQRDLLTWKPEIAEFKSPLSGAWKIKIPVEVLSTSPDIL